MSSVSRRSFMKTASLGTGILATAASQAASNNFPEFEPMPVSERGDSLNVALLQMVSAGNDQPANLLKGEAFCRKAASLGADIALFPEMFNIGYVGFNGSDAATVEAWRNQAIDDDGEFVSRFRDLARELDMAIAPTYLQNWNGPPRSVITIIDRHGEIVLTYAKVHTCDFANFEAAITPGHDFYVTPLDTRLGPVNVGAMICFDREFPESARINMLKGAELILTPNACPLDDMRLHQFQARAWENSLAVFMTNYADPHYAGRSVAYGPNGETLVEAGPEENVIITGIHLEYLRNFRKNSIWGSAFRRPQRYAKLLDQRRDPVWDRETGLGEPFDPEKR